MEKEKLALAVKLDADIHRRQLKAVLPKHI